MKKLETNYHWRAFVHGCDLEPKWRVEFDYMSDDEFDSGLFIKYRDWVYDLGEFMRTPRFNDEMKTWHGYKSDSFFSGVLIRIRVSDDGEEQYQIATYRS